MWGERLLVAAVPGRYGPAVHSMNALSGSGVGTSRWNGGSRRGRRPQALNGGRAAAGAAGGREHLKAVGHGRRRRRAPHGGTSAGSAAGGHPTPTSTGQDGEASVHEHLTMARGLAPRDTLRCCYHAFSGLWLHSPWWKAYLLPARASALGPAIHLQ